MEGTTMTETATMTRERTRTSACTGTTRRRVRARKTNRRIAPVQEVATFTADGMMLDSAPVAAFAQMDGCAELPQGPFEVRVVLPNGAVAIVDDVICAGKKRPVTLVMYLLDRIELAEPALITPGAMAGAVVRVRGRKLIRYRLKFRNSARIALAPGCERCDTVPGEPCSDDHPRMPF